MNIRTTGAASALLSLCAPAFAQVQVYPAGQRAEAEADAAAYNAALKAETVPAPAAATAPVSAIVSNTTEAVLRVGTEVPLKLSEELTTKGKKLKLGHRFRMETAAPVMVRGFTAVPAGSPAIGEITEVRNKGGWGKSGHFTAQILYVTVEGRQIRLTGTFDDKGKVGTGAVVGAVLLSPLIVAPFMGFFVTGTSAQLPIGTPIKGFVNEEVALAVPTASQPLLAVSTPTPPAASGANTAQAAAAGDLANK